MDGLRLCVARRNINVDDGADPYFFDADYTIAGSTGLARVWEGGWILVELLQTSLRAEVRRPVPWLRAPLSRPPCAGRGQARRRARLRDGAGGAGGGGDWRVRSAHRLKQRFGRRLAPKRRAELCWAGELHRCQSMGWLMCRGERGGSSDGDRLDDSAI